MTAMQCPVCQGTFREVVREGIIIDVCSQCKGVWLDRGELEKLLASVRTEDTYPSMPNQAPVRPQQYQEHSAPYPAKQRHYYDDDKHHHSHGHHGQYRKKSKLENLFDIFD